MLEVGNFFSSLQPRMGHLHFIQEFTLTNFDTVLYRENCFKGWSELYYFCKVHLGLKLCVQ